MTNASITIRWTSASDGTGSVPEDQSRYTPCDDYFLAALGQRLMEDLDQAQPNVVYQFDRLPSGYSGWQSQRTNTATGNSRTIDRYIYGHDKDRYRSTYEFYDHVKHLYFYGVPSSTQPCLCCKCSKYKRTAAHDGARARTPTPTTFPPVTFLSAPAPVSTAQKQQPLAWPRLPLSISTTLAATVSTRPAVLQHLVTQPGESEDLGSVSDQPRSSLPQASVQDSGNIRRSAKKHARHLDDEEAYPAEKRRRSSSPGTRVASDVLKQTSKEPDASERNTSEVGRQRAESHDHTAVQSEEITLQVSSNKSIEHEKQPPSLEDTSAAVQAFARDNQDLTGPWSLRYTIEMQHARVMQRKSMPGRIMGKDRQPGYNGPGLGGDGMGRFSRANTEEFEELIGDFYG